MNAANNQQICICQNQTSGELFIQLFTNANTGNNVVFSQTFTGLKLYTANTWLSIVVTLSLASASSGAVYTTNVWTSASTTPTTFSSTSTLALDADYVTNSSGIYLNNDGIGNCISTIRFRNVMMAVGAFTNAQAAAYMAYQTSLIQPMLPALVPSISAYTVLPGTCGLSTQRVQVVNANIPGCTYALKVSVTNGVSGYSYNTLMQQTLSTDVATTWGWGTGVPKPVTISLWLYSNVNGCFFLVVRDTNGVNNWVGMIFVSNVGQWTQYTFTVVGATQFVGAPTILLTSSVPYSSCCATQAVWNYNTTVKYGYLGIQANNFNTTFIQTTGNYMMITGLQVEAGGMATPFETRALTTEQTFCSTGAINSTVGQGSLTCTGNLTVGSNVTMGQIVSDPTWGQTVYAKNRIINGSFTLDTVNNGALVTVPLGTTTIGPNNWRTQNTTNQSMTMQVVSTNLPAGLGFTSALKVTLLAAGNGSGLCVPFFQNQTFNIAYDLLWGTPQAKAVTMSLYLYSSINTTYYFALRNGSYSYVFPMNAGPQWTLFSFPIQGQTNGSWIAASLSITSGPSTSYSTTSLNQWMVGDFYNATTDPNQFGQTAGAYVMATGFQFELGSVATPFQQRSIATESAYLAANSVAYPSSVPLSITGNVTQTYGNMTIGSTTGYKNRVINGDMRIDTLNNGNAIAITGLGNVGIISGMQVANMWGARNSWSTGSFTAQRVALATNNLPTPNLTYAHKFTIVTPVTTFSGSYGMLLLQTINGANLTDITSLWGTSGAMPVTISFYFLSTIATSFYFVLQNAGQTYTYVTSFAINYPNIWQYITITVVGPTVTSTWNTGLTFVVTNGSSGAVAVQSSTPGAWAAGNLLTLAQDTGAFMSSAPGNYLMITGIQLEAGVTATPFEYRSLVVESQFCNNIALLYNGTISGIVDNSFGQGNLTCTGSISAQNMGMFRNRVINGDMRINQRGSTSTVISGTAAITTYTNDRWGVLTTQLATGSITFSNATLTSSDAPYNYGFTNALLTTATTGCTYSAGFIIPGTYIEGYNIQDFNWGLSTGKTVTLSFWLKSNVSTISVCLHCGINWLISYNVNVYTSVGVWQYVTLVVPPPPVGTTWNTKNGSGVHIAIGSWQPNATGAANTNGTWSIANYLGNTGASDPWATTGNYVEFTGVQLEKGTIATPFEFRPYAFELQLCQRYFYIYASTSSSNYDPICLGVGSTVNSINKVVGIIKHPIAMLSAPSIFISGPVTNMEADQIIGGGLTLTGINLDVSTPTTCYLSFVTSTAPTAGSMFYMRFGNTAVAGAIGFSAELV